MKYVVMFASQFRNGKDTAADYLWYRLNQRNGPIWYRASFARKVKKIFAEHFGVSLDFIEEWKVKKEIPEGFNGLIRDGLTMIGNCWREIKEDIWIEKLFKDNQNHLVISDCRYINEALSIKNGHQPSYMQNRTGLTILMWRPGFENDKPSKSEQELMPFVRQLKDQPDGTITLPHIPFDLWLKNDGSKEDLFKKIDQIILPKVKQFLIDN